MTCYHYLITRKHFDFSQHGIEVRKSAYYLYSSQKVK